MQRKIFYVTAIILALAILLTCYYALNLYYDQFHSVGYSDDPAAWGQFGDYVGGVLNPLVGFLTLIFTIWLTILVNRINEGIATREQIHTINVATMSLRNDAVKEIRTDLIKRFTQWGQRIDDDNSAVECLNYLNNIKNHYNYLFDFNNTKLNELEEAIEFTREMIQQNDIRMVPRFKAAQLIATEFIAGLGQLVIAVS